MRKLSTTKLGRIGNFEKRVMTWLYARFLDRLMRRFGGIQTCPWCHQVAQAYDGWRFDSKTDPSIDELHCGNCGGTSRWRFEMGMIPLTPLRGQPPKEQDA